MHLFMVLKNTYRIFFPVFSETMISDTTDLLDGAITDPKMGGNGTFSRTTSTADNSKTITPLRPAPRNKAFGTMTLILVLNASMVKPETCIVPSQRPANNTIRSDVDRRMTLCTGTVPQITETYSVSTCRFHTAVWLRPLIPLSLRPSSNVSPSSQGTIDIARTAQE